MDVLCLRDAVVAEYRKFATPFTTIHAEDIRRQVEAILRRGPLLAGAADPDGPELQACGQPRGPDRRGRAAASAKPPPRAAATA